MRLRTLTAAMAVTALAVLPTTAASPAPAAVTAPAAAGSAACPAPAAPRLVGEVPGVLFEGAVVDRRGRLHVTDLGGGRVFRFDAPGAAPVVVATLPEATGAGALALDVDGSILVGGGADARVFFGDTLLPGTVSRLDPDTGTLTRIASGFSAANGLAVAHDGTIFATNDFGSFVGRLRPGGRVEPAWTFFNSANGAVLSSDDRYLYVSRTFVNAGVSRIPVDDPGHPQSLLDLRFEHVADAPDGLTLDSADRPVVPTDVSGEIFRIERPGVTCLLANGIPDSSVVVYGRGTRGFAAGHLYRAGFDGKVYEIPAGFDAGAVTP